MELHQKPKLVTSATAQDYLSLIRETIIKYDPNVILEEETFTNAKNTLSQILPPAQVVLMNDYLDAENLRLSNNLKRILNWGKDDSFQCIEHPDHRDFIHRGFEEIIDEDLLNNSHETKMADIAGQKFFSSLSSDVDDLAYKLIDYSSYIETVWYKFAHLVGFFFAVHKYIPFDCPKKEELEVVYREYEKIVTQYLGFRILVEE